MGSKGMNYGVGGASILGGAALSAFAPELGIPLLMSGIGTTAGEGAGGSKGAAIGGLSGGLLGGLGEGLGGMGPMGGLLGGLGKSPVADSAGNLTAPLSGAAGSFTSAAPGSSGGGLADMLKSPLANTMLGQVGNFANAKMNKQAPPNPQLVSPRPAQINPVTPAGPPSTPTTDASPLMNYASLIKRFSPAMAA